MNDTLGPIFIYNVVLVFGGIRVTAPVHTCMRVRHGRDRMVIVPLYPLSAVTRIPPNTSTTL
jgi:hypothetical protein